MITRRMAMGGAGLVMLGAAAKPVVHEVRMLNRGAAGSMVFEPGLIQARVGDVVRFLPTDPGHNAELIRGMTPDGVPLARGVMNRTLDLPIRRPGLYGVKCAPHLGMGMVALIAVGNVRAEVAAFQTAAARLPTLSRRRMTAMLQQVV
ncbi:pseudoazurin [Brevundimonas diminuta]|uniref:Pseudoazurin n=1 Tax=Brevundimonas diminuta TaxID=293 RepID=A0A1Z3LTV2_BREDI|nr:pseudoazurin [Brevundimonas diminuta]ASD25596.1 pseudoazurin [Brevundimonas diminuta]